MSANEIAIFKSKSGYIAVFAMVSMQYPMHVSLRQHIILCNISCM